MAIVSYSKFSMWLQRKNLLVNVAYWKKHVSNTCNSSITDSFGTHWETGRSSSDGAAYSFCGRYFEQAEQARHFFWCGWHSHGRGPSTWLRTFTDRIWLPESQFGHHVPVNWVLFMGRTPSCGGESKRSRADQDRDWRWLWLPCKGFLDQDRFRRRVSASCTGGIWPHFRVYSCTSTSHPTDCQKFPKKF